MFRVWTRCCTCGAAISLLSTPVRGRGASRLDASFHFCECGVALLEWYTDVVFRVWTLRFAYFTSLDMAFRHRVSRLGVVFHLWGCADVVFRVWTRCLIFVGVWTWRFARFTSLGMATPHSVSRLDALFYLWQCVDVGVVFRAFHVS